MFATDTPSDVLAGEGIYQRFFMQVTTPQHAAARGDLASNGDGQSRESRMACRRSGHYGAKLHALAVHDGKRQARVCRRQPNVSNGVTFI
jgi:hypothetical protein